MKIKPLMNACAMTFGLITATYASETMMQLTNENIQKATYISMTNQPEKEQILAQFLKKGAATVRRTEPGTPVWFGLKNEKQFAIFDVFFNEEGREKHFSGQVAHALKENAPALVKGGWEKGVLDNVNHYNIIAANYFSLEEVLKTKVASYIAFKAKPGKEQELGLFLQNAALLINKTEPQTKFWLALKTGKDTYAIFDAFLDQSGCKAHFSGKVAAELQKQAGNLIEGGWEQGVLANVHHFQVIAAA